MGFRFLYERSLNIREICILLKLLEMCLGLCIMLKSKRIISHFCHAVILFYLKVMLIICTNLSIYALPCFCLVDQLVEQICRNANEGVLRIVVQCLGQRYAPERIIRCLLKNSTEDDINDISRKIMSSRNDYHRGKVSSL